MRTTTIAAIATLAAAAAALAAPDGGVDRERLGKIALLPSVGPSGWYYEMSPDGRTFEGGQEPWRADVATLRARLKAAPSDADRWTDLAAAYRRVGDAAQAKTCLANAIAILRREAAAHADDGRSLAALGLALAESGDDAGADEVVASAERALRNAWAGIAASADLLLTREIGRVAGSRFSSFEDAGKWLDAHTAQAASLDVALVETGAARYDAAVAAIEKSGATGAAAASTYLRRRSIPGVRKARDAGKASAQLIAQSEADERKALELLPTDPLARTLIALNDAMSDPDPAGGRHVEAFEKLSEAAHARLDDDMKKLNTFAESPDAETAARALQGIACVQYFVHRDIAASGDTLWKSIAKCPDIDGSWSVLVWGFVESRRWDGVVKLCDEWMKHGATAAKRMIRAKALSEGGHAADAETEWRAAVALEPRGFKTNLGLAVLVMRRATDDAALKEAGELLDAAAAAPGVDTSDTQSIACLTVAKTVHVALTGDLDVAEKAARAMIERFGDFAPAREILAAIGR